MQINRHQLVIAFDILFLLISFVLLFISEFNYLKIGILIGVIIFSIFIYFYFTKEELITKNIKFYKELENFFDLLSTPFCLYNDNFELVFINNTFASFCGISKENLKNLKIGTWIIKNPNYLKLSLLFFPVIVATEIKTISENPGRIEVKYGEEIFLEIITTKIFFEKEILNAKIVIDKTEAFKTQIREKEMINTLVHHLRTPLNQIKWGLENIDKSKLENSHHLIESLLLIVDQAIYLAESVVVLNKLESNKLELVVEKNNVEDLIKTCLAMLQGFINEKKLKVKITIEEGVEEFYFDKKLLFFILYPIIENAVDYNKEEGEINIEIAKLKDRNYVSITISDTGIGIKEKDLKNLFTKYFRGENAQVIKPQGLGLGLSLAYNLLKFHKGTIEITSKENEGTSVKILLPAYKEIYSSNSE